MKVILVSYFFAPRNAIGSIRATKIAKYLTEKGHEVTVITSDYSGIKDTLLEEDSKGINIYRIGHSKSFKLFEKITFSYYMEKKSNSKVIKHTNIKSNSLLGNIKARINNKIKININFVYTIFQSYDFLRQSKKLVNSLTKQEKYDVLFGTYGPLASLILSKWIIKKNKIKKSIIDFRDPVNINGNPGKFIKTYFSNLEKWAIKNANAVTCVTVGIKDRMCSYTNYIEKIYLVNNGYDSDELNSVIKLNYELPEKEKFSFCYTGGLYRGKRNIRPLFQVLRRLIDEKIIDEKHLEFKYAGPETNEILSQAKDFNLEGIIEDYGIVERKKALQLQYNSRIFIIATWNNSDDKGVIPGKLYEGFLLKKPIISLVSGNETGSELGRIIHEANIGVSYENADPPLKNHLYDFIIHQYNLYISGKSEGIYTNNKTIEKYLYPNLVSKIEKIMFEI